MRKIVYLGLIFLVTGILISGCKEKVDFQADGGRQPHQFGGFQGPGQEFTGGNTVRDYNLSSVRRVPHPELVRLVFEFTQGDSGEFGEAPPDYTVRLEKDSQSINIILNGVTKADILKNKQQVISLSKLIKDITFTPKEGSLGIVSLELQSPVTFQVFDLGDPARVVVVLKPEGGYADKL